MKKSKSSNKMLEYFSGLKLRSFLAPFFKLLEAIFELLVPLVVSNIMDIGVKNNDKNYIITHFILLIGLAVCGLIFSLTAQYFSSSVANKYACRLRQGVFEHVQTLSHRDLDSLGNSTLLTRMTSDVNQIQSGINMFLRLFLRSPFIVLGALVMAFIVDAQIAIVFAIVIPILSLIVFLIMRFTLPRYSKIQTSLDSLTKETRENLTGVRVIRAFTSEEKQIRDFEDKNQNFTKLQIAVGKISSLMNPLTVVVINIGVICILYFGGIKVNHGNLSDGQVFSLYNYLNYILIELIKFANLIINVSKSIACSKRINALFNVKSTLKFTEKESVSSGDYINFDNVTFKYNKDGKAAIKNINFKAEENQTIGIIGGTGAGKSTLINLLCHNYDATEGKIIYKGQRLDSYSLDEIRNDIGLVPQKAVLFEGTIKSNLLWGKKDATDEDIANAIEISQSKDIISHKAKGLDEPVEQNGRNFSGGQKQRLTIARALVKHPKILILDDSSSALDLKTDKDLRMKLKEIHDMTIFIISQRTSSLVNCDKILVLDKGELVDQGTHEELLKRCKLYQDIHYCQYEKEEK